VAYAQFRFIEKGDQRGQKMVGVEFHLPKRKNKWHFSTTLLLCSLPGVAFVHMAAIPRDKQSLKRFLR